jgi:hypothetical protein
VSTISVKIVRQSKVKSILGLDIWKENKLSNKILCFIYFVLTILYKGRHIIFSCVNFVDICIIYCKPGGKPCVVFISNVYVYRYISINLYIQVFIKE